MTSRWTSAVACCQLLWEQQLYGATHSDADTKVTGCCCGKHLASCRARDIAAVSAMLLLLLLVPAFEAVPAETVITAA
jgi:hypothetical protein